MAGPKKQHHVPQMLQRNFLAPGTKMLWYYNREADKYEQRTPNGIGHARNQYTYTDDASEDRFEIEKNYSKLESDTTGILQKIDNRENISPAERKKVAEFIAAQYFRTPQKMRTLAKALERGETYAVEELKKYAKEMSDYDFQRIVNDFEKETGKPFGYNKQAFGEMIQDRDIHASTVKNDRLNYMLGSSEELAKDFVRRSWFVMHAPKNASFITSDVAIHTTPDGTPSAATGFGPGSPGIAVVFPISKSTALLITSKKLPAITHAPARAKDVKAANQGLARVSNELYSHSKTLLEAVVKRGNLANSKFEVDFTEDKIRKLSLEIKYRGPQ